MRAPSRLAAWRGLAAAGAVLALAAAAWASVQVYRAESLIEAVTLENLEKAALLVPHNSNAWARLGALRETRGDSLGAVAALDRAVALNRYNAGAWIDLGLHWEMAGDLARAEQRLLEAVRADGTFQPRWALANYYARRQAPEKFWPAIREAIARNRFDAFPAFELCWRVSEDPEEILERAIPDHQEVHRRYFQYLSSSGRIAAAGRVWQRLEGGLERRDLPGAFSYLDSLLAARQTDTALRVWNGLVQKDLIPHGLLLPEQGRVLTNGQFRHQPSGRAFDWGIAKAPGISGDVEVAPGTSQLRLRFDGTHPESTDLLSQQVPVLPRQSYRFGFSYLTSGLPAGTGLSWAVYDAAGVSPLAAGDPLPASGDQWSRSGLAFRAPPQTRLVRVLLRYRRAIGTTRAEGSLALRDSELSPAEEPAVPARRARATRR